MPTLNYLPTTITLVELFKEDTDIRLIAPMQRSAETVPTSDLMIISLFCKKTRPKLVVEFGTARCRTALNIAANTPDDCKIITIDSQRHLPQFAMPDLDHKIEKKVMMSYEFDPRPYRGQADFIFIDGDHNYEGVKVDSLNAIQLIKPGGTILWHDYHPSVPGVMGCLHELAGNDARFEEVTRIIPDTTYCYLIAR